jgi:hypothetical protein
MSTPDGGDDKVGFGNPPKHSRFKKGESGNPSGKKKKSMTLDEALERALSKEVAVMIGGKKEKKAVVEILVGKAVNKALEGEFRFLKLILEHGARLKIEDIVEEKKLQPHHLEMLRELLDEAGGPS